MVLAVLPPPRAKPLPIQPFADEPEAGLTAAFLFAPRPGGGPRGALLTGAPQSSDDVDVGIGRVSAQLLPFVLLERERDKSLKIKF